MATTVEADVPIIEIEFDRPWTEEVLRLEILRVDRSYQREPKVNLINSIGAAYDLALGGYIFVSHRADGHYYIVDGQQRAAGARKFGEEEILARVFEGLTPQMEAQYYDKLNDTQPQLPYERFKAAFAAGDPEVNRIWTIVHSYGACVFGVDSKGDDAIAAVAALRWIFAQGGEEGLSRTLGTIRRAFGRLSRHTTPSAFMKGVFFALDRHEEIDDARLAKRIEAAGMTALKQHAVAHAMRNADATGFYVAVLNTYNHRLAERKRLNPVFRRELREGEGA